MEKNKGGGNRERVSRGGVGEGGKKVPLLTETGRKRRRSEVRRSGGGKDSIGFKGEQPNIIEPVEKR